MTKTEISGDGGIETGDDLCVPNISQVERRKRLAAGVIQFLISLVILIVLVVFGVSRWWRLLLLPLFMGAASG